MLDSLSGIASHWCCENPFPGRACVRRALRGDGHTRSAIIRLLLESGPITASSIGEQLGLSAAGVRRHLDALIDAGDAQANAAAAWQQEGRGRPAKRYRLTAAGRAKLEHTYDDLASAAMRQLREIGGDEAVEPSPVAGSTRSWAAWNQRLAAPPRTPPRSSKPPTASPTR